MDISFSSFRVLCNQLKILCEKNKHIVDFLHFEVITLTLVHVTWIYQKGGKEKIILTNKNISLGNI